MSRLDLEDGSISIDSDEAGDLSQEEYAALPPTPELDRAITNAYTDYLTRWSEQIKAANPNNQSPT